MNPYFFERYLQLRRDEISRAAKANQRLLDARHDAFEPDQVAAPRPTIRRSKPLVLRMLRREG